MSPCPLILQCIFPKTKDTVLNNYCTITKINNINMILSLNQSNFTNCSLNVQDPIQDHVLHFVVMSLWSPSIWNTSSVFPYLSWPWNFQSIKAGYFMECSSGSSDVSLWLNVAYKFLARIQKKWFHTLLCSLYQEAYNADLSHYWSW